MQWNGSGAVNRLRYLLFILCGFLPACVATPAQSPQIYAASRVVDLAHVIAEDMPLVTGATPTRIEYDAADYQVRAIRLGVRSGTSLTILSTSDQSLTVDRLSPRDQLVPAVVIDVREQAWNQAAFRFSGSALREWEAQYGQIAAGSLVLLATGWDIHWGDAQAYLNIDAHGQVRVPGFSADALHLLLHERQVRGIGVDTPAALLEASDVIAPAEAGEWWLLENLTRLEQLPPTGSHLVIGNLRIQASASSPASILALVP